MASSRRPDDNHLKKGFKMKKFDSVFKYSGIFAAVAYIAFTFISHLFNTTLNPINNWLSDYGSPFINPSGYKYYNLGYILVALLLAVFLSVFQNGIKGEM